MARIKPFRAVRPRADLAARVAALPYDVYNREEALAEIRKEPLSFLQIDRAETQFPESVNQYVEQVYARARDTLWEMLEAGILLRDEGEAYYVYELTLNGRSQTGLVGCAAIDDYLNNIIKKHEKTREDKELDRIKHVAVCNAQTGPIFLAYRSLQSINEVIAAVKEESPLYDFVSPDGVRHTVWKIAKEEDMNKLYVGFRGIEKIYIADGHHRAASAVQVGLKRREELPGYSGDEEFNYFLSVLFPHDQLMILAYNRVVRDLAGYTPAEFLRQVSAGFKVEKVGAKPYQPREKATFGMYLEGVWYKLTAKNEIRSQDPVAGLDVSILQEYLLKPILKIGDVRTDKRIDFVGGIRGLKELEKRVQTDMKVAFAMFPTSIEELFAVADAGELMPPKSTWFEPKLRSGLFIHELK